MNKSLINTAKSIKRLDVSDIEITHNNSVNAVSTYNNITNVYSFPANTSSTGYEMNSSSNKCNITNLNKKNNKIIPIYTINLDWVQFKCVFLVENPPIENQCELENYNSERIVITKECSKFNPNFKNRYTITKDGIDICEAFTSPITISYKKDELIIKILNHQLYSCDWIARVRLVMAELRIHLIRFTRIDIALDSNDILMRIAVFNMYRKSDTIQSGNDALSIEPKIFNKKDRDFSMYRIGKKDSGRSALVYNKSQEIIESSDKNYIADYWRINGLDTSVDIGRFELQLSTKHLKSYFLTFENLTDAGTLSEILKREVKDWLKLYKVKRKDMLNHRKEIAIKKGKEVQFIVWDALPTNTLHLEKVNHIPDPTFNAKRAISFSIKEIIYSSTNIGNITLMQEYVVTCTAEHDLYQHTLARIKDSIDKKKGNLEALKELLRMVEASRI